MKRIKQCIIILIILLIFLMVLMATIIMINLNKEKEKIEQAESHTGDITGDIETEVKKLNDHDTYYTIEKIMQNYYMYLRVQNKTAVYSILDEQYKTKNSITEENVIDKLLMGIGKEKQYKIKEIYGRNDLKYPTYFIYMYMKENSNQKAYYIFYVDNEKGSFSIEPVSEEAYNSYIKSSINIKENTIEANSYNKLTLSTMQEEEIVKKYFEDYVQNAIYNSEEAYNSLDEGYKKARFENIERYRQYLNKKQEELISMDYNSIKEMKDFATEEEYIEYISNLKMAGLNRYQIIEYEGYTQYVCIDDYENYYIFNSTSAFQYSVILDTYTVDLPEFIKKYNNAPENEKVLFNIQKVFEAINSGDYKYVYNKLDSTFKQNNFPTEESFENYIKNTFYTKNTFDYSNYQKTTNSHIYDLTITNADTTNKESIKKTFIMQLQEGTDFVMSFNVE